MEFAIEREKPEPKDNKKDKEPIKVTVKVTDDKSNNVLEVSKAVGSRAITDNKQQECNQLVEKARLLREQCVELEKKKQVCKYEVVLFIYRQAWWSLLRCGNKGYKIMKLVIQHVVERMLLDEC